MPFTIKVKEKHAIPAYMDMTVFRPRRPKVMRDKTKYVRNIKHKGKNNLY